MSLFHRYWWYGVIIAIAQIFSDCPVIVRCLRARGLLDSLKCVEYSLRDIGLYRYYVVYSLLSFVMGRLSFGITSSDFLVKLYLNCHLLFYLFYTFSSCIYFTINYCFFVCSSPYCVRSMSANKWQIVKSGVVLLCQSQWKI